MPDETKKPIIAREIPPQPAAPETKEEEGKKIEQEAPPVAPEKQPESFIAPTAPPAAQPPTPPSSSTQSEKSEELRALESILEEGLEETYWRLPPALQPEFRKRGESTARAVEQLLRHVHLNIAKVLRLIRKWLSFIPHVNRFFIEQESKIKTDKIVALHKRYPPQ